jgi:Zn-dependent protease
VNAGIPIARIAGVEIRVSLTLAMLLAVVTLLGAEQAGATDPNLNTVIQWLVGGATALLFLVSVIGHELAHALMGRSRGIPSPSVLIGFIGSLAPLTVQAVRPRDELAIAVAGPLLSLGIAALLLPAALLVDIGSPLVAALAGGLFVVGGLNLVLGVVSCLPGLPLDGGRVVRALVWAKTGDVDRAGRITASVGRLLGWAVAGAGIVLALVDRPSEGILLIALGWLLSGGSRTVEKRLALESALRGAAVSDALVADVLRVPAGLTVDTFADRILAGEGGGVAVVMDGDHVLGIIGRGRLARLRARKRPTTRAGELVADQADVEALRRDGPLWPAIEVLNTRNLDGLPVLDGDTLLGAVTRASASEVIRARWPDAAPARDRRRR